MKLFAILVLSLVFTVSAQGQKQESSQAENLSLNLWVIQKSFFSTGKNLNASLDWALKRNDSEAICQSIFQIYGYSESIRGGLNGIFREYSLSVISTLPVDRLEQLKTLKKTYESYADKSEMAGTQCAKKEMTRESAIEFYEISSTALTDVRNQMEALANSL